MKAILSASVAALLVASAAHAGSPRLFHIEPAGAQRGGAEIDVVMKGNNLGDPRELLFDDPGFTVTDIKAEKNNRVLAKIKVAPEVTLGEHRFRLVTKSGISDVRLFYVSPFPMVAEQPEDKTDPKKPQPVSMGVTIYGQVQNEDEDRFEIEAKKGERISVEAIGMRIQTQTTVDPAIAILKLDGTPLLQADDVPFTKQDPVASAVAPEDGKYLVSVRESTNTGAGEASYLLNIGNFPRPLAVLPSGGPAGEEVQFTFLGDATGPIQRTIRLPETPVDTYPLYIEDLQPAPQPVLVRVSPMPNALEAEPNDSWDKATPVPQAVPFAANGVLDKPEDIDFFKFTAKKGMDYDLNVYCRKLRSGVDPVLDVYNAKGVRLNGNDDSGTADSYLRWKAPDDGDFYVSVRDQLRRGNVAFTYRIEVTPVQPSVAFYLPEMTLNQNQDRRAVPVPKSNRYATLVRFKRKDVGGDFSTVVNGLPAGVQAIGGFADKAVDTFPLVFEAAPDAELTSKAFTLTAKFVEPEKAQVPSAVEHAVDIAENSNQRPYYTITETSLPVAVIDEVPAKIELHQPKVPILQNGSMPLKVHVERKEGFKGAVTIALLYAPPGIGTPGTIVIKEGENEGSLTISATSTAAPGKWKTCIVGSVDTGMGPTWISTQLIDLEIAPPPVTGQLVRSFVDQGDEAGMTLKLEQKQPFEGKAKAVLVSLPAGVSCEEQEFTKDDKEIRFKIKASPTAQVGQSKQVTAQLILVKDGEPMQANIASGGVLRVDKASVAQK